MRTRDEIKERAVIEATVKIVNEIGFASASISKIAKEAGVSVATIYIYHKDKEDLMHNVYYEVKKQLTDLYFSGFESAENIKEKFKMLWRNVIFLGSKMPEYVFFAEQFSNSPYYEKVKHSVINEFLEPMFELLQSDQIKKIPAEIFVAFFIVPANFLGNRKMCLNFELTEENINKTFELAWETIKKIENLN